MNLIAPVLFLCTILLCQQRALAWWPSASGHQADELSAEASSQAQQKATSAARAEARFEMDGVSGYMRFSEQARSAPNNKKPVLVEYELRGLHANNELYHVHVKPVPPFKPDEIKNKPGAIGDLCNEPATGGHWNPTNVKEKLKPKSAPFDRYEAGDLSGKHGALAKVSDDLHKGSFVDPTIELAGPNGIVGRSIVIHKTEGGKRWVCASIVAL